MKKITGEIPKQKTREFFLCPRMGALSPLLRRGRGRSGRKLPKTLER